MFDERKILSELNPRLRREVILHNTAFLINSVPLFEDISEDFMAELGSRLEFSVFAPNEVICAPKDWS